MTAKLVLYSDDQLTDTSFIFDAMFRGETVELWNAGSQHRESMREKWPAHTAQLVQDQRDCALLPSGLFRISRTIEVGIVDTIDAPQGLCTLWWFLDELREAPIFSRPVMARFFSSEQPRVYWDAVQAKQPHVYPCVIDAGIGMVCIEQSLSSVENVMLQDLHYPPANVPRIAP